MQPAVGARDAGDGGDDALSGVERVEVADGALRLAVDPGRAAEVNHALVAAGVAVSELRPAQQSLETVFLRLTQEQQEALA